MCYYFGKEQWGENSLTAKDKGGPGKRQERNTAFRVTSFFVLITVVIALAVLVYMNYRGIDYTELSLDQMIESIFAKSDESIQEVTAEIGYDIKNELILGTSRDTIIKYLDNTVVGLDNEGKKIWGFPFPATNPYAASADAYIAVADINGKKLLVIKGKNKRWEIETDEAILNISINKDGYTAAVHEAGGCKGAITVYDPEGGVIFTKTYAERFVLDAQISSDNREVLINTVDISGARAFSSLEITDIYGSFKAGIAAQEQSFFPYVGFMAEGRIAAADEEHLVLLNRDGSTSWNFKYKRVHSSVTLNREYFVAAVSVQGSKKIFIEVWDKNGRHAISDPINEIVNIRQYDDIIAVNTGREIIFMDPECKSLGKYSPTADILDLRFLNRIETAVITRESIHIFKLGVVD